MWEEEGTDEVTKQGLTLAWPVDSPDPLFVAVG